MVVDLHSHYPMHILGGDAARRQPADPSGRPALVEGIRRLVLRLANRTANYPDGNRPAVTSSTLFESNIRIALSVLFLPFEEMDLDLSYGAPPQPHYFSDLRSLLERVNRQATQDADKVAVALDRQAADRIVASGRVALVHAVEGGFHLGGDEASVRANLAELASLGVAYLTVAHLFWRRVATNAPGIPFLPEFVYRLLFPQPDTGLCPLGRVLVNAMIDNGVLIDVTHMSEEALAATFALLDARDPGRTIPVLATHGACRAIRKAEYNLDDQSIAAIIRRNGVVGLIAARHWMAPRHRPNGDVRRTVEILIQHIEHIEGVARNIGAPPGHHYSAIGSDQDGFIKPSLTGLEFPAGYGQVQTALAERYPEAWQRICSENALRVLDAWGKRPDRTVVAEVA